MSETTPIPSVLDLEGITAPAIDTAEFKEAAANVEAANARVAQVESEFEAADQAVAAAWAAYKDHINGVTLGERDHTEEDEQAVQAAEGKAAFLRRKVELVRNGVDAAKATHHAAWVEAHRPLFETGARIRIEAARLKEYAEGLIAQAEAQGQRGAAMIQKARDVGFGVSPLGAGPGGKLKSPTEERETWGEFL